MCLVHSCHNLLQTNTNTLTIIIATYPLYYHYRSDRNLQGGVRLAGWVRGRGTEEKISRFGISGDWYLCYSCYLHFAQNMCYTVPHPYWLIFPGDTHWVVCIESNSKSSQARKQFSFYISKDRVSKSRHMTCMVILFSSTWAIGIWDSC